MNLSFSNMAANPLEDIHNIEKIKAVIVNGAYYNESVLEKWKKLEGQQRRLR